MIKLGTMLKLRQIYILVGVQLHPCSHLSHRGSPVSARAFLSYFLCPFSGTKLIQRNLVLFIANILSHSFRKKQKTNTRCASIRTSGSLRFSPEKRTGYSVSTLKVTSGKHSCFPSPSPHTEQVIKKINPYLLSCNTYLC